LNDEPPALGNVSLEGTDVSKNYEFLWSKYRIITAAIKRQDYRGLRITPNVYTTLEEIDAFSGAVEDLLKNGSSAGTQA
jgi:isopenicillin-N epimerase